MRILLDMNLSPDWVGFLQQQGLEAVHWSALSDPKATDAVIMECARQGGYVVFTHDLDFSALLSATQATGPSVIRVRTQNIMLYHRGLAQVARSACRMALEANPRHVVARCNQVAYSSPSDPEVLVGRARALQEEFPNEPSVSSPVGDAPFADPATPDHPVPRCITNSPRAVPGPSSVE